MPRARLGKWGVYNPAAGAKKNHKLDLLVQIRNQSMEKLSLGVKDYPKTDDTPIFGNGTPLTVEIEFYLPLPEKMKKKRSRQGDNNSTSQEKGRSFSYESDYFAKEVVPIKPDLDNLIKYILDVGNEILYYDDKQIVKIQASKYYGEPRTDIRIKPAN